MFIIRSLIFNIYFIIITLLISTFGLPFAYSNKYLEQIGRLWAYTSLFGLKWICGLKMKVVGIENIPEAPFLVASKHQSVLETIAFWIIFRKPTYILKKELTKIPLYGIYLIKMGMIAIDRKSGTKSLRDITAKADLAFKNKQKVIIFPEGTRTLPGQDVKHRAGVSTIYEKSNIQVLPVALNTGYFWPSKSFIQYKGEFTIQILPPIKPGIPRKEFEDLLYNNIENYSKLLSRQDL